MKKRFLTGLAVTALVVGAAVQAQAAIIGVAAGDWTGSRTGPAISGIDGQGNWITSTDPLIELSWEITLVAGVYTYTYTFVHAAGETSHFILQISDNKICDDLSSISGGTCSAGTFSGGSSNPGMPNSFYGVKFDGTTGNTTTISFQTLLDPIWGSFYAKDGKASSDVVNAAWNTGLNTANRPAEGTTNFTNWIPTPDGFAGGGGGGGGAGQTIPEPATLGLFGLALAFGASRLRRRQ